MHESSGQALRGRQISVAKSRPRLGLVALCAYANDFLEAATNANLLAKKFRPAQLYLACHALELALRAYIQLQGRVVGVRETSLPSRGDLVSLLAEADSRGLTGLVRPSPTQREQIQKAAFYYSALVFEYPALAEVIRGYPQGPDADGIVAVATALVSAIREKISASTECI